MIFVYGTLCRDRLHRVERLPEPGGYVEILEEVDSIGGEAYNTSVALLSWGEEVVFGGNSLGSRERDEALIQHHLTTKFLPIANHFEPVCDIYVTPDGQRTMFGRGFREMAQWGAVELLPLQAGCWLTADANHGATAHEVIVRGRRAGMYTYVEDFVEPNATESDFWQSSTDWVAQKGDIQANVAWLEKWIGGRGGFGILSDGANGFVAGGKDVEGNYWPFRHYPPFPCPSLIDSTGAGDIFRAGMLLGFSRKWSLPDCLRFASAAGCLNCQQLGANTHIPSLESVQDFIACHTEIAKRYE